MADKSFFSYLFEKFNLIGGVVAFIVWLVTVIKTQELWLSLSCFLALVVILLLITLNKIIRDIKNTKKITEEKNEELYKIKQKYDDLDLKFANETNEYNSNIKELNKYKEVMAVVQTLTSGKAPKTEEAKKVISMLKFAVKNSFKDSEK
jgi:hypothetical protein